MIVEHLFMGGISFMLPIYIMWIVVIFFTIKFLLNYYSENRDLKKLAKQNSLIIFIGSFAFLFGLLGQIIGLYNALLAIQAAGDISPALMAGGLRVSLIAPLYGFVLFLISGIIWFIFRNLIKE
ncbi:MAG: MotA/TolQ/ExbB proton channel family protein [Bacteroidales bacterium]|nr:MotA/TolQ/ExbB proton channel family protein [Bacteroidales bacterium]